MIGAEKQIVAGVTYYLTVEVTHADNTGAERCEVDVFHLYDKFGEKTLHEHTKTSSVCGTNAKFSKIINS